jgi:hypothetical protein
MRTAVRLDGAYNRFAVKQVVELYIMKLEIGIAPKKVRSSVGLFLLNKSNAIFAVLFVASGCAGCKDHVPSADGKRPNFEILIPIDNYQLVDER